MSNNHTYPALEELKEQTDGLEALVEIAPRWLEGFIEYAFEMDYLRQKQEILDRRDTVRERFITGTQRIESTYGTVVNRALKRRADGEQPSLSLERLSADLDDAKQAIEDLRVDLDEDYLTIPERRQLNNLREDIFDAREYARNKRRYDESRTQLGEQIATFDQRWEPYEDRDTYMISSDETYLIEQSAEIWEGLSDMARELKLHILPDSDSEWLSRQKSRFGELVDALPQYNDSFVKRQKEEYKDVLTSDHGELNEQQQKAVIRNDRRNLVDASAGTGKTLTLTHRFMYLLEKGVPARRIVAITYMGDAADEMKSRIANESSLREDMLQISTIHSFARKICMQAAGGSGSEYDIGEQRTALVRRYFNAAMNKESPDPNQNPEIYRRFQEAFQKFRALDNKKGYIDDNKRYDVPWRNFVLEKLEDFVKNARTFELSADEIRGRLDESHAVAYNFGRAAACLVEAYEQIVAAEATPTDFDDMIQTARRIVKENPEKYGNKYNHILVDEYQDVSQSTLEFIDALVGAGDDTHLFCVGDDWQSIMGFTGSNVRYFTEFEDRYDDVTYTSLKYNYRCPPQVVDAGSDLIEASDAPQNEKAVEAFASGEEFADQETLQLHILRELYESRAAIYAADQVEQAIAEGYDYNEIMVLSRNDENSQYMYELRQELKDREIPHRRPDAKQDYIPETLEESLDHDITVNDQNEAVFVNDEVDAEPPLVTLQSVHSAKGTEAPIVIFLHAVGNDPDGIPTKERTDALLQPSTAITSEHVPEERRLFYVALTRAEEQFKAITKPGGVTQFILDIEDYFTAVVSSPEVTGVCVEFNRAANGRPHKATLDCGSFEADLVAWPDSNPQELVPGEEYQLSEVEVESDKYGEEIRYDKSEIEKLS